MKKRKDPNNVFLNTADFGYKSWQMLLISCSKLCIWQTNELSYLQTMTKNGKLQDSKTFLQCFQGYFEIYLQKLEIFWIFGAFPKYLQLPGIEPAILWLESRCSTDCAKSP